MDSADPALGTAATRAAPYWAAFHQRLGAALVDVLALCALQVGLGQIFGVAHTGGDASLFGGDGLPGGYVYGLATMTVMWQTIIVVAYFTIFEGLFAATPGKASMGLRVVDARGRRASPRAVALRNLVRPIDALPFLYLVGLVCVWSSPFCQRLGDRAAGTYVVPVSMVRDRPVRWRQRLARSLLVAALALALAGSCAAFYYFGRPALVVRGLVNLSSGYGVANTADPPSVCGPWLRNSMSGSGPAGTYNLYLSRHIAGYAVGQPRWGDGVVTVPLRIRFVSWDQDRTGTIREPTEVARLDGPDTLDAAVTLRWAGPGAGGWVVAGAETRC